MPSEEPSSDQSESEASARWPTESVTASVVICAYTEQRWSDLDAAVDSIRSQKMPAVQCVVVVDHNPELLERAQQSFKDFQVIPNCSERGLAGARNTGVLASFGDIVAFLDDDARAESEWLAELLQPYSDPLVMGTGGAIRPLWRVKRPRWFPDEFAWVVGCSYVGLPNHIAPIRNPIGAGMSFRRSVFEKVGGFSVGIGRVAATPLGCEETELGIRVNQQIEGSQLLFVPDAIVHHAVNQERTTLHYFFHRCYAEGLSKALVTQRVGRKDGLSTERSYVTKTLPSGVAREVRRGYRGEHVRLLTAGIIVLGLLSTGCGYAIGTAKYRVKAVLGGLWRHE